MPIVNIKSKFRLNRDDGTFEDFIPGPQHVSEEDADHWYVQAHCKDHPKNEPQVGTFEYQMQQQAKLRQRQQEEAEEAEARVAAEVERQARQKAEMIEASTKAIRQGAKQALRRETLKNKVA